MPSLNGASEIGKAPTFEILSHVDPMMVGPRLGRLSSQGRKNILTPDFLAVGSRGVVPHITPDVLAVHTRFGGVHMALEDFIERATEDTPPILHTSGSSPLHSFTSLPRDLFTLLAPRRTPAVLAPVGNSNTAISVFTSKGFQVVSNQTYISYIERLRPDVAIGLADVPYGAQPGTKRLLKMGDRTQEWLSQLLKQRIEGQAVFAPILPIDIQDQSEYVNSIADDLAHELSGLAFYDSNVLPDMPATSGVARLPRLSLDEPSSPRQILRQVSHGMDIFTVPFVGFATDAGIALSFQFPRPSRDATSLDGIAEILPLGIDLWHVSHATSLTPLDPSCSCYTCTDHHRAYVQHLLSAKEMLGWVLLQIHNHHILSAFFAAVRESIQNGTFDADCADFARAYEPDLPGKSGQGPRVRGYHFKSEGPGQAKKNKPAWGNLGGVGPDDGASVPREPASGLENKGFAEMVD